MEARLGGRCLVGGIASCRYLNTQRIVDRGVDTDVFKDICSRPGSALSAKSSLCGKMIRSCLRHLSAAEAAGSKIRDRASATTVDCDNKSTAISPAAI
jgi:hypothetical protein